MKRKVTYVRLQGTDAFFPGVGTLGNVLPPMNKTFKSFNLYDIGEKLLLEINGAEYFVPIANVQVGKYGPEEAEEEAAKAS